MATVQELVHSPSRHEAFVDSEIARASRRIRAHDVGVACLGLVLGTLIYALAMVLLDRWLDLPGAFRQAALIGYSAAAGLFAGVVLTRPFRRQLNPYYAARQVERAVPAAKNSVVNWLDLRDEPLAPTIKAAIGARAASDLTKADFDEVLRDRRLNWLGAAAGALAFAALLLLFILRPGQFLSLIGRAFAPFASTAIAKQTELSLLQPAGGDITVPVNQSIEFRVYVQGRNPDPAADDAVRLRMRYNSSDEIWEERRLDPTTREPREWVVRVPAVAVQNGFEYQIVGGDAATQQYRVSVRSSPLVDGFDVRYHFRPYLRIPDQSATNPNLESFRGTTVDLTVRTNRNVREGWLRFDKVEGQPDQPSIAGELVPEQPTTLRFHLVMERDAKYRVHFTSLEGDANQNPIPYTIKVLSDHPPQVEITRAAPGELAINGTLNIEGKASDDFGLTKLRLYSRLFESDKDPQPLALADHPFRDGKSFRFDDGTFPRALDYKETVPLELLRARGGLKPALKSGSIIEYWLEAEDNCDYPKPNVGQSKHYRVTLGNPKAEDEKKAAAEQARADKQEFDKKQDEDLKNENEMKKGASENPPPPGENPELQPSDKAPTGTAPPPDEPPNLPSDPQKKAEEKKAAELAKKIDEKLREKEREAKLPKAEAKPVVPPTPPTKPAGAPPKPAPGGAPKPSPAAPTPPTKGSPPDGGPKGDAKPDLKNPNQPNASSKGDAKRDNQPPTGGDKKGEAKPEGQPEAPPQPGEAKPMQSKDGDQPKNDGSPAGQGAKGDQPKPGAPKPDQPKNDGATIGQGTKGDQPKPGAPKPDQPKNDGSPAGQGAKGDQTKPGAPKPDAPKDDGNPAGAAAKGDQPKGSAQPNPGEAKDAPKPDSQAPGEAKLPPKDGMKPGESKDAEGAGDTPKPGGDKSAKPQPKPGDEPGATPPNATTPANPAGKPDKTKPDAPKETQPDKKVGGPGGEGGVNASPGDQTKTGPKNNPTQNDPKKKPDGSDPGKDGPGGKTGSGQPDQGTPPDGAVGKPGEAKGRGKPELIPAKAEAKPDPAAGAAGASGEKGDLQDALKGSGPGPKPRGDPKTDGTSGDASPKPGGDESVKPVADNRIKELTELAKNLTKLAQEGKNRSPADAKASAEKAKEFAEAMKKQTKELSEALQNADPKLKQELSDTLEKLGRELAKQDAVQPKGDLKPPDELAEAAKELAKAAQNLPRPENADGRPDATGKPGDQGLPKPGQSNPIAGAPGDGTAARDRPAGDNPPIPTGAVNGDKPDARHAARAGELLLEEFKKKVDRKILDEMKMTEEEYAEFLRAYEALVQRQKAAVDKNDRQRGASKGGSGANTAVKRVQGGTDKPGNLERGGAALAPPEMRDGYKGFTEDVSKTGTTPKDKK